MSEISVIVIFANHSIFLDNITHSSFNKSVAWIKLVVPISLRIIVWLSIRYNERNRNVYLGKICAQMYTMKRRANEPTFRKMSANVLPLSLHPVSRIRPSRLNDFIVNAFLITLSGDMLAESLTIIEKIKLLKHCPVPDTFFLLYSNVCKIIFFPVLKSFDYYKKNPRDLENTFICTMLKFQKESVNKKEI